jgi:peptidoglycan/LPS O-acetylase OafA/YrhL
MDEDQTQPSQTMASPVPLKASEPAEVSWRPSLGHIPALDGLRGLAILTVMCHHFLFIRGDGRATLLVQRLAHCGLFGVDLFFVLSGFLITGILLDTQHTRHALLNFYMRRTLRIFPLYYFVLLVFVLVAFVYPLSQFQGDGVPRFQSVLRDWPWYVTFTSNVLIGLRNGYVHGFLDVSWSLSIEEQYYLIWALTVLALPRKVVTRLSLFLLAASAVARCVFIYNGASPLQVYVSSVCHADGLALGSYYAAAIRDDRFSLVQATKWAKRILAVALPLFVILAAAGWLDLESLFCRTIGYSLVAAAFSQMLVLAIGEQNGVTNILRSRFLVRLGVYSYGLYLLHLPVRAALAKIWPSGDGWRTASISGLASQVLFVAVGIAGAMVLALVARRTIEEPALRLKRYFPRERVRT